MSADDTDNPPLAIWRRFGNAWFQPSAEEERARVIAAVGKNASDFEVRELHRLAFMLEAMDQGWKQFGPTLNDPELAKEWRTDIESGVAHYAVKILTSPDAGKRLEKLASFTKRFPLNRPPPSFINWHTPNIPFNPSPQDGTKAVMLGAYFALMKPRPAMPESRPTIGELDRAIRENWKWHGDDKELREARRKLGLSGLPRGKGGRPKKQRGKK